MSLPLGAYIHLPWCLKKCPYCDFNSHTAPAVLPDERYVDALIEDLDHDLPKVWGRTVASVFIGGGTPSLFSGAALRRLLDALRSRMRCHPGLEVTMECNPGTAEYAPFEDVVAAGVNRLSIGAQSFNDELLVRLGRVHKSSETRVAVERARAAGITNLNLDIMFGLPGQSSEQGLADLQQALDLQPTHLSWYQLTIEPNTMFAARPPVLPDEDVLWHMQTSGQKLLRDAGYRQYEVSAWALPGHECRHNINYWSFGDYLGIGAGAHAKLTMSGQIERTIRQRQPNAYLAASAADRLIEIRQPERQDLLFEFMLNALRLKSGFSWAGFTAATGLADNEALSHIEQLQSEGLLEAANGRVRATELGFRFLDEITARFLPDPDAALQ